MGTGEEKRKTAGPLSVEGHSIEPSLSWKLLDILSPHAYAAQGFGYTDNLFHEKSGGTDTPFSRSTLGARGDVTISDHVFSAGYRATYADYFNADRTASQLEQRGDLRLDLNFRDVSLHGDGAIERIVFPNAIQIVGLAPEWAYSTHAATSLRLNRFSFSVGGNFRRDDFENTGKNSSLAAIDHNTYGLAAQFGVTVAEKLTAVAEYNYEALRFDQPDNVDYDSHSIRGGLNGSLTPKVALSLKVGYTYQIVQRSQFAGSGGYQGFNAACSASWEALPVLTLGLAYRRDLTWAVGADFTTVDFVNVTALYKFGPAERLTASADVGLSHGYVRRRGTYDRFTAQVTFGWKILKWLSAQTFYRYSQAFGTQEQEASEYSEHQVGVSLAVGF